MRSVELAKVAAAAEALRLRRIARRQAMRGGFGAIAGVFAGAVLVVLHVLLWHVLLRWVSPVQSTLIVLVVDVVIAAVFGFLASRNTPDTIEREAKQIRQQAMIELKHSLTLMSMVAQTANAAMRVGARSGARRGAASVLAEAASRLIGR